MLNRKHFLFLPAVKNSRQKLIIRGQFLHFSMKPVLILTPGFTLTSLNMESLELKIAYGFRWDGNVEVK